MDKKPNNIKLDENTVSIILTILNPTLLKENQKNINENIIYCADLNKILLKYLYSHPYRDQFEEQYVNLLNNLLRRHKITMNLIETISEYFEKDDIQYTYFKTIKPFKHTPNDIDIILNTNKDIKKAYKLLYKNGWVFLDNDKYGITMYNRKYDINIDLHLEIMVSNLLYLNKNILIENINMLNLNDRYIITLNNEAEIVAIISHIAYKEHMLTISDIITIYLLSKDININKLYDLIINTKISSSFNKIIYYCLKILNKSSIKDGVKLYKAYKYFNEDHTYMLNEAIKTPYNIPIYLSLHLIGTKIMNDNYTRSSLLRALYESANIEQIINITEHFRRKTY